MSKTPQIISDVLTAAYTFVVKNGGNGDKLLAGIGLSYREIDEHRKFVSSQQYLDLLEAAAEELNEPNFGLKLSAEVDPANLGSFGYLGKYSRTLREAYYQWSRYQRLLNSGFRVELAKEGDIVRIWQHAARPNFDNYRQVAEFGDAFYMKLIRQLTGVHITPQTISFVHSYDGDTSEHERVFGCPVLFGQPKSEIILDRALLDLLVTTADEGLLKILSKYCEIVLAKHARKSSPVVSETQVHIVDLLPRGRASAKIVSEMMGVSERTLSRRLAREGTSFKEISDELHKDLAVRYIERQGMQISEVAFLLGYSSQAAFARAYRRWFGKTPRQSSSRTPLYH
ncbi:MAG: AraC family transcriptional regulator [Hyphomicrobiales bacterium]